MESDQITVLRNCQMKVGNITVSHKNFGVVLYDIKVQIFHHPAAAVSSSDTEYGLYFRIGKHLVYPLGTDASASGHVTAVILCQIVCSLNFVTQLFYRINALRPSLPGNGRTWTDNAYGVSLF